MKKFLKEKNIAVSGYWNTNLGDDLFLKILANRYPNCHFIITVSKKNYAPFSNINNITPIIIPYSIFNRLITKTQKMLNFFFPGTYMYEFMKYILAGDVHVEIGGSIFMQPRVGMDRNYRFRKMIFKKAKNNYILGSNFGPFYKKYQVEKYKKIFEKANQVTFRDLYSYDLFYEIGPNVQFYPDIVFNLDVSKYIKGDNYLLISIIDPNKREDSNREKTTLYFNWLLSCIKIAVHSGESVVLMSFCEAEGDYLFAKKLYNALPLDDQKMVKIYNHHDVDDSLTVIAQANKIIACRYHAMILSWLFKKPVFVVSYSSKITNVIHDLAPEQNYVILNNLNNNVIPVYTKFPDDYFKETIYKTLGHFKKLDNILKEK